MSNKLTIEEVKERAELKAEQDAKKEAQKEEKRKKAIARRKAIQSKTNRVEFVEYNISTKNETPYVKFINKFTSKYLTSLGFGLLKESDNYNYVRIVENVIDITDTTIMLKALESFIKSLPTNKETGINKEFVLEEFQDTYSRSILHSNVFAFLPDYTERLKETAIDTKEISYVPFNNGILKVTADNVELIQYSSFNGLIWRNSIKKRDFVKLDIDTIDESEIRIYLSLVSLPHGKEEKGEAHKRSFFNLVKALGYNLHSYKDPSKSKMIIVVDTDTDNPLRGGAGKSLFSKFIGIFRNVFTIDGKLADNFLLSGIKPEHDIIVIDDMAKFFPIDMLTTAMTGELIVNNKTGKKIQIPFSIAPKFTGNTNFPIDRNKAGMKRRLIIVEFNDYFNTNNTPQKEFEHLLIDEWNKEQFNIEDNFLAYCLQYYFKEGLPETKVSNEINKVIKMTLGGIAEDLKDTFERYIDESNNINKVEKTKEEVRSDVYNDMVLTRADINNFGKDLKKYCDISKVEFKNIKTSFNGIQKRGYLFDFSNYVFLEDCKTSTGTVKEKPF